MPQRRITPATPKMESPIREAQSSRGLIPECATEFLEGGPAGGGPPFVVEGGVGADDVEVDAVFGPGLRWLVGGAELGDGLGRWGTYCHCGDLCDCWAIYWFC